MTRDEMGGHIEDVLARPLSNGQMMMALSTRTNGADSSQLLAAALAVARAQANQKIAELECALDDSEQERWRLEVELQDLRAQIEARASHESETP